MDKIGFGAATLPYVQFDRHSFVVLDLRLLKGYGGFE